MTRMATAAEHADHNRDLWKHNAPSARIRSVSYLTAYLDTLLRMNVIPAEYRAGIRATVDSTRKVHDLPDLGPRERADA